MSELTAMVNKRCSKWVSGLCLCKPVCVCVFMYACLSVTLCLCECMFGRAVSFGLVVSIIRSLSFTPVSFSLFLSLPLTLPFRFLHFSISHSTSLSLLPRLCASEWWVLNHPFILRTMMNEGKSVLFSLFILLSISVPLFLFCSLFNPLRILAYQFNEVTSFRSRLPRFSVWSRQGVLDCWLQIVGLISDSF